MIKNYFKIAFRNIRKHKGYSLINISGLAVGLACSFFILLWVHNELSYDRFHKSGDRIYRIWRNETNNGIVFTRGTVDGVIGPTLEKEYPEIENATYVGLGHNFLVTYGDQNFRERGGFVSADFFEVFTFPLIQGSPASALESDHSIVISEALALRLFGKNWREKNVVGKALTLNYNGNYSLAGYRDEDFTITGVARNAPAHSSIQFDFILPAHRFFVKNGWTMHWDGNIFPLYVRLREGTSLSDINAKIANVIQAHAQDIKGEKVFLQPFEEMYLYGKFENGVSVGGRINLIRIFVAAAVFLLLIARINYMNLAMAQSTLRSKEIGIRKAIGSTKKSLMFQFIFETMILAVIAFVLAMGLVTELLPVFSTITGQYMQVADLSLPMLGAMLGIALLVGLFSGCYPALYLSSFNPVTILRGVFRQKEGEVWLRKGLVIIQFALSALIIICTMAVYFQIHYILNRDLGMDRSNLVSFKLEGGTQSQYDSFRQELMKQPGIANVTASSGNPLNIARSTSGTNWAGKDPDNEVEFNFLSVNYDFLETMKMKLVSGRSFSRKFGAEQKGYIINEQAAKVMGKEDPVGDRFFLFGTPGRIIGVVKNFHMSDISRPVSPTILLLDPANTKEVWVRTEPGKTQKALAGIEATYKKFNPGYSFSYEFMDTEYEQIYRSVLVMGKLANIFAVIAIIISCLGLFGLAAFTAERRTKEIGVRKVLGASVWGIVGLLSTDFLALVAIAYIVACPLAYIAVKHWLSSFAYHVDLGLGIFLLTASLLLTITLATVSWQSIKAALANPVDSLRSE